MISLSPVRRLPGIAAVGDRAIDWGYATGWLAVRAMPEFAARGVFAAAARYAARGGGPDQLRRNLARVISVAPGDVPDELVSASLASYARYWREAFRLPSMDHVELAQRFDHIVYGKKHLYAAMDAGRGTVIALPHSGNWDAAGIWLTQRHGEFTTVVERLKPESLYRRFVQYRENFGFEVLPLSGGDRPVLDVLKDRAADNGLICLLADRDLTRHGIDVRFFGETTRMPAGPAKLGIETGAAVLPVDCYFDGDGWGFRIHRPLDCESGDVHAITQKLADHFAAGIAAHPADWHMLQPQWLADLPVERRGRLEGC